MACKVFIGVNWGYTGILEKKMETTIEYPGCLGFRVLGVFLFSLLDSDAYLSLVVCFLDP